MEQREQVFINEANIETIAKTRTFIGGVFSWMFLALLITAFVSYIFGTNIQLISLLADTKGLTALGWVVMISPLAMVLLMSFGAKKFSFITLSFIFLVYSVLMGMSLSFILLVFSGVVIFKTFVITSAMFGTMAIAGYYTKMDLTRFGSILYMALVGIIIASIINIFMGSFGLGYLIDVLGVIIFTGLTAYDMQKIKNMGQASIAGEESTKKLMLMGALNLYLDFINLFLFLLRLFGGRK